MAVLVERAKVAGLPKGAVLWEANGLPVSATPVVLKAAAAGFSHYVIQAHVCNPTVAEDAVVIFEDTTGTPVELFGLHAGDPVLPGKSDGYVNFGPQGLKVTTDKGLNCKSDATGLGDTIVWVQGYTLPTDA